MKKFYKIILTVVMMLSIVACGKKGEEKATDKKANNTGNEKLAVLELDKYKLEEIPEKDKDYKINVGYYNCDHMTAACIGEASGIYESLGLNVELTGNGKVPEAVSAGKMDAGYIGTGGLLTAIPKGAPIYIAANNHKGGSYYLVTSNDIKSPEDLKGKKLAIGSEAEFNNASWVNFARRMDIPAESKNYETFDMFDQDAYFALKAGHLDGYTACDPWGSMAEFEGTGKIMATSFDVSAEQDESGATGNCCSFILSKNFSDEHPELAKRLLFAHTKSIEYMYTHPYDSAMTFAKYYNVPEEVGLMTIYKKLVAEGRTITWEIEKENIANMIAFREEMGVLNEYATPEEAVDTSLLEESGCDDFDKFIKEKVDPILPEKLSYDDFLVKAKEIDNIK